MKHTFILLIVIGIILSCSPAKKLTHEKVIENSSEVSIENDGSSYEKAIVINEKNETAGIRAEYAWLAQNYPGYQRKMQALNFYKKKPYDILTIITANGVEKEIYFDISKFYGKF